MAEENKTNNVTPTTFRMPDGRSLYMYGGFTGEPAWPWLEPNQVHSYSHRRWHPMRREWVVYSAHRQSRTYKPPANDCPFCPGAEDGELPFQDFSIAVFDNRFSSLQKDAPKPEPVPGLDLPVDAATGNCEVIVYSSDHKASMASLPLERRELLVKVWGDRIRSLLEVPAMQVVMPFENRGEEAGVTLHHPHGQIYGFGYLPPIIGAMAQSFREGYDLSKLTKLEQYVVADTPNASLLVPPFTRFPYELWIVPKQFRPSPAALSTAETTDVANLLARAANTYDTFFGRVCPYVMLVYSAPKGFEDVFPFHIQFQPLLRAPNKMKFIAGCELGAGSFLVDILPETAAQNLRNVEVRS
ncbi:galactose-1-phosphate uridylyltransferase [Rhizomicrobium electricum]|uniref:Galactose-1-phosphate uridylyltransferase n=1 Tax=Rhizomicrobium electricum TaxID=480070 RepID=A0ABN1EBM3_9PROT|nr:galactose-1-phosphate uridylyltransferase [Rhizomicrobium electricum]NIJ48034.1 UDPglucose--hexose-1-phosphate uridylyltransferase [Rhizomicrobium electricum]